MKKQCSAVLACVLCCVLLLTMMSCSVSLNHPIREFAEKVGKAGSYQMKISIEIPDVGTCTGEILAEGNLQYTSAIQCGGYTISEEYYTETDGDMVYTYEKYKNGQWVRTEDIDDSSSTFGTQIWDPDNYEKVKGSDNTYKQKEGVVFDTGILSDYVIEDVVISVGEDSCILKMTMMFNGIACNTKMYISNLGNVSVTLPKVS